MTDAIELSVLIASMRQNGSTGGLGVSMVNLEGNAEMARRVRRSADASLKT